MVSPQLHPEIWSHICSFLYQPSSSAIGVPGRAWRELHQHDLTVVMRVNTILHDAAAPHLYSSVSVANLPSLFHSFDQPQPDNRLGKLAQLQMIKEMTLFNPKTYIRSSRREPSPNAFMIDPVYPYPDRRTLRVVDDLLDSLAGLSECLEVYDGSPILPQLAEFTLTTINTDKWDLIEKHILAGPKDEKRYLDFKSVSKIFESLVKNTNDPDRNISRHWRLWPINGPYSKAGEAIFNLSPKNTTLTQHIDEFSIVLPDVQLNRLILLKPLILEHTIPRYLNWPELSGRLRVALANAKKNQGKVEIECRLVPTAREAKEYGRRSLEKEWEMDKMDEINLALEEGVSEEWRGRAKLIWTGDQKTTAPVHYEERRGR